VCDLDLSKKNTYCLSPDASYGSIAATERLCCNCSQRVMAHRDRQQVPRIASRY
jgi:hypothetical protein